MYSNALNHWFTGTIWIGVQPNTKSLHDVFAVKIAYFLEFSISIWFTSMELYFIERKLHFFLCGFTISYRNKLFTFSSKFIYWCFSSKELFIGLCGNEKFQRYSNVSIRNWIFHFCSIKMDASLLLIHRHTSHEFDGDHKI